MFSRTIPFSSESKLSQFVFLFLLLSLYLCGNTDHFTTEFPLQCLPHPEHWNMDFTLIPPSREVTSFSVFLLSQLSNQLAPFLHQPAMYSPSSRHSGVPHVSCASHLTSRFFHKEESRLRCAS